MGTVTASRFSPKSRGQFGGIATPMVQKTAQMQAALEHMRRILEAANKLYHEEKLLQTQGEASKAFRKKVAGDLAMEYWRKKNNEYKRMWKRERRKAH